MILFFALLCLAAAIAGATAFVIFWPLTLVHLRDRQPELLAGFGSNAFAQPSAWAWLLLGGYRTAADRNLSGLATPARIALLVIIAGLVCSGVLYTLSGWLA
ncbi:MAG TPA: hypothetical protein VFS82_07980 [Lysobacter sp.]|nr:hypothetical protein [Lysobacter sp.]